MKKYKRNLRRADKPILVLNYSISKKSSTKPAIKKNFYVHSDMKNLIINIKEIQKTRMAVFFLIKSFELSCTYGKLFPIISMNKWSET